MSPRINKNSSSHCSSSKKKLISPKSPRSVYNRLYNLSQKPASPSVPNSPPKISFENVDAPHVRNLAPKKSASCKNYLSTF